MSAQKKLALSEQSESKGFTLVELMVVITIIAILSVIGVTVFSGVQKNARDTVRRGDINALATALELNYSNSTYTFPNGSAFGSGSVPKDPLDGSDNCQRTSSTNKACWYCVKGLGVPGCADTASRESWSVGAWFNGSATSTVWMICANLENGTVYCKSNAQ